MNELVLQKSRAECKIIRQVKRLRDMLEEIERFREGGMYILPDATGREFLLLMEGIGAWNALHNVQVHGKEE